jgi:hypothetical protein
MGSNKPTVVHYTLQHKQTYTEPVLVSKMCLSIYRIYRFILLIAPELECCLHSARKFLNKSIISVTFSQARTPE